MLYNFWEIFTKWGFKHVDKNKFITRGIDTINAFLILKFRRVKQK